MREHFADHWEEYYDRHPYHRPRRRQQTHTSYGREKRSHYERPYTVDDYPAFAMSVVSKWRSPAA
jgi:hypothetical protein